MRRRDFIKVIAGSAATWPLAARGQQAAMPVIGFLHPGPALLDEYALPLSAFRQGLGEAGFVEGAQPLNRIPVGKQSVRSPASIGG